MAAGGTTTLVNLLKVKSNDLLVGNGVTGTGSLRVTIASDNSALAVSQSGTWTLSTLTNIQQFNGTAISMKAASTAAAATDTSLVVALSPNSPLPAGTNGIGKLTANDGIDIGDVTINNLIGNGAYVRVTDGTNTMPTGDAAARGVFHRITDGTNTAAVIATINSLKTDFSSVAGTATVTGGVAGTQGVGGVAASGTATASAGNPLLTGAIATTAAPSYTTSTSNPLSLTTGGSLRVDVISSLPAGTNTIGTVRLSAVQTNFGALGALNQVIGPWDVFNQKGTTVSIFSVSAPTGITVVAEVTIDGTNWVPNAYMKDATGVISSSITNAQLVVGAIRTIIVPQGTYQVRLRMSTWTSGTVNFIVMASHTDGETNLSISPNGTTSQPVSVQQIGGWDGTNLRAMSTDASGRVNIGAINSALPTGTNSIGNLGTITSLTQFNGTAISMKAASTAAVVGDPSLVVALSPNSPLPAGTNAIGKLTTNTGVTIGAVEIAASQTLATVTTVSTVTNLSQLGGAAIAMGTGVRSAGTQRVTIATDDVVPASQSGTWNINNLVQLGGQAIAMGTGVRSAGTQRVTIATDDIVPVSQSGTWNINAVTSITNALPAGTNTIGKVDVNQVYAEDAASAGGENLFLSGAVRQDTIAATTSADGDYTYLKTNNLGRLYTSTTIDAALPAGTNSIGNIGTVSTVTNLSQLGGTAIAMNTGVRSAGTQRVTIATDDLVPVSGTVTANAGTGSFTVAQATAGNLNATVSIAAAQTLSTVSTVSIVNSLTQMNGQVIAMGTGVRSAGTQRVTIATDDVVQTKATPDATGTYAGTNATTSAYANNLVVKASAGTVYMLSGFNSLASPQFIQIHNATSLPADASVPTVMFYVPALSNFCFDFGVYGRYFSTGIVVCNSTTGPTKTSGAANCWFDAQYK